MSRPLFSLCFVLFLIGTPSTRAQEILTAAKYFEELSGRYGKINDYEADISISRGETQMSGRIYYRSPNLLRIDFDEPAEQVLVSDGEKLTIYIPRFEVIMEQQLKRRSDAALALMKNTQGLSLLERNYSMRYLVGPDPMPIDEGSGELVVKLALEPRATSEGFRQIVLSISEEELIRRIKAITLGYEELVLDFSDVKINQNIPEQRFEYDSPPYANVFSDFLFEADE